MSRYAIGAGLLLVAGLASAAQAPAAPSPAEAEPSARAERWLHNSGERTTAGRKAYAANDAPSATEALDQALRLRPELPEARFNAGTGRLRAGASGAAELLESAAQDASPSLAPLAYYNLGNARLAGGDARGAVAAYRESLLRDPASADAKHNLELALRRLEQQQKNQQQGNQGQQQKQPDPKKDDKNGKENRAEDSPKNDESKSPREQPKPEGGKPEPKFEDQPDMNAQQAAALLAAVENLERDQRRRDAQRRAAARAKVEIDW